ncbi:hypothetical protein VTL71DRAFT_11155 [Oculimacula yallundae]|uniref:Uncharacterized protein n=1 Tax=Oculimacula yallundae TaxID=86028 RepID=A0ABR4CVA2_9HELO
MSDDITKICGWFLRPSSGDDLNIGVSGGASKTKAFYFQVYMGACEARFQQHREVMIHQPDIYNGVQFAILCLRARATAWALSGGMDGFVSILK